MRFARGMLAWSWRTRSRWELCIHCLINMWVSRRDTYEAVQVDSVDESTGMNWCLNSFFHRCQGSDRAPIHHSRRILQTSEDKCDPRLLLRLRNLRCTTRRQRDQHHLHVSMRCQSANIEHVWALVRSDGKHTELESLEQHIHVWNSAVHDLHHRPVDHAANWTSHKRDRAGFLAYEDTWIHLDGAFGGLAANPHLPFLLHVHLLASSLLYGDKGCRREREQR